MKKLFGVPHAAWFYSLTIVLVVFSLLFSPLVGLGSKALAEGNESAAVQTVFGSEDPGNITSPEPATSPTLQIEPDQVNLTEITQIIPDVPPVISGVQVTNTMTTWTTVVWTTDQPADTVVNYGNSTKLVLTVSDAELTTEHSILLTGLGPGTTYYFEVRSTDYSLNTVTDNNSGVYYSFTTPSSDSTQLESQLLKPQPSEPQKIEPRKATALVDPAKDVELKSPSGKITLDIPAGAASENLRVDFTELTPWDSTGMQIVNLFELDAYAVDRADAKVNQFQKELTITIKHAPEDLRGLDIDSLRLYYLDELTKQWAPVSSKYDPETMIFTATVNHFTCYGCMCNPVISGPGRVMGFQVDMHSGSATYAYPIEVPPGAGEFQPNIALTYDSGIADEMKNKRSVGSWVGIGWTLNLGCISYDASYDASKVKYYLILNNLSYELVQDPDNPSVWRTVKESFFKITRSGQTWTVYDTNGVYYRFGGDTTTQQYFNDDSETVYYRWDLDLIQDTHQNTIGISYLQDIWNGSVRSAYPQHVYYNNNNVDITFNSSYDTYDSDNGYLRNDNPRGTGNYSAPTIVENRKLDSIEVKLGANLVRKYNFAYTTTDCTSSDDYGGIYYSGNHTLTSIAQVDANGNPLPATTFGYTDLQTFLHLTGIPPYEGNPGNPASFNWPHLTSVSNGYGATVTFTYTEIPGNPIDNIWTREVLTTKTINPGIGPTQTYQYTYTGNPQYYPASESETCCTAEYRGFSEVKETDAAGNWIKHYYWTTGSTQKECLTGKEYQTDWGNSTVQTLKQAFYNWNYTYTAAQPTSAVVTDNFNSYADGALPGKGSWVNYKNGNNWQVEGTTVYEGAKAVSCAVNSDSVVTKAGTALTDGSQRFYFNSSGRSGWGAAGSYYLNLRVTKGSWGGPFLSCVFYKDGTWAYFNGSAYVTGSGTWAEGVWNYFDFQWRSSDKAAQYRLNGGTWSAWTTFYGAGSFVNFDYAGMDYYPGGTGTVYVDTLQSASPASGAPYFVYLAQGDTTMLGSTTPAVVTDNFDSYADGALPGKGSWVNYKNGNNWQVEGTTVYEGAKATSCSVNSDSVVTKAGTALSDGSQRFYFNSSGRSGWGAVGSYYLNLRVTKGSWGGPFLSCLFYKDGTWAYFNGSANVTGSGTWAEGAWNFIDFEWRSSDKTARYRLNGGTWSAWTTFYGAGSFVNFDSVGMDYYPGGTGTIYVDTLQSASPATQTGYLYDSYGNVITQYNDGDLSTSSDDSTMQRVFYVNTSANILDKVARERLYATITGDVGGANLKSETRYYYDGANSDGQWGTAPTKGDLTRLEQKKDESSSVSTYYTYDTYGNMLTETDPNGNTITYTYDTTYHTFPVTKQYPIVGSESYTWDYGSGKITSDTDVNNQTTTYEYDTFKRLVKVIKPGDSSGSPTIQYQYNNWGTVNQQHLKIIQKISDGSSIWRSQYFDGLGRVVQTQAQGETGYTVIPATTTYNNRGLVDKEYVSQVLSSGSMNGYYTPAGACKYTTFAYDALGRVTSQTGADGTTVSHDFSTPWKDLKTNEMGNKTAYYDDAFSRLVKVEEYNASQQLYSTTTYSYDVLNNLKQAMDNGSNTITMNYDWLSRKTSMSDPDMGSWSYTYDNNGNLQTQTDARSQPITFSYDALNRLTGKSGTGLSVTYTYDSGNYGKGWLTGMTDASGNTTYKYDTRGRLIEETHTIDSGNYTTQYSYNPADWLLTVTYPTGETVTQTYNGRGLPYSLGNGTINVVTGTQYNKLGQYTEINLGNGIKTTFGYYGVGDTNYDTTGGYYGNLWEIKSAIGESPRQDIKYTWDAAGNLASRLDEKFGFGFTEIFTYDFLNRLTAVSEAYQQSFSYNQIGNILSMNGNSYTYGTKPHAVTAVGSTSYAYDANGNMITHGNETITWDVENRPTAVGNSTFVYDGDGNRVKKIEDGQTTIYIGQYYEKNITTGEITTYYYLGDKLVALGNGTNLLYIHQDILGSTSAVTDSSGTEYGYTKYYPYGLARVSGGSLGTDKEFTGQRLDGTGLYYYNARYYDPSIGRFISADTIVPDPADPQSFNRYSYCINNPLRYTDPSSQFWDWLIDWASIVFDVVQLVRDPSLSNIGILGADVVLAAVPFVPAGVGYLKTGKEVALHGTERAGLHVGEELGEQGLKRAAKVVDDVPSSLLVGPKDTHVYFGYRGSERVYVGIAKNVERRVTQYGERFTKLEPLTRKIEPLTRRQARAIEQTLILRNESRFENIRNSISPNQKWYNEAVEWGEAWLKKMGY